MSTNLKEWLLTTIAELEEERDATPGAVNEDAAMALEAMKRVLASLEADSKLSDFVASQESLGVDFERALAENMEELYVPSKSTPPAPVFVPDELTREEYKRRFMAEDNFDDTFRGGWNACRAAMLQGVENAETPTTMQTASALDSSPKNAESPTGINQGKSEPVTTAYKLPEGWVAVPVEPTEEMIAAAMCSNDVLFDKEDDTLFRVQHEEIWRAMLSTAPQQEVK
ncbi:hypothetical protein RJO53_002845 [Enterobacter hormaechei]|nr:hypothetical protein [Enterobacter hormaechei]ELC6543182.1 hypothetical protein [Enterobacter hormaechei]